MTKPLPKTTTERLLAVADLIENEPTKFDMGSFGDKDDPVDEARNVCGTAACVCGWAIRMTSKATVRGIQEASAAVDGSVDLFEFVGARLLGLDDELAEGLFCGFGFGLHSLGEMPGFLRNLASLPESQRTRDNADVSAWLDGY